MKLPIAIYARVSTEDQAAGWSLETQIDMARQWAIAAGYCTPGTNEPRIYADIHTGSDVHRPEIERMLRERHLFTHVVCYKFDRLTRSVADWVYLFQRLHGPRNGARCTVLSATQAADLHSASGRLYVVMLVAFAEYEREQISDRTKDALAKRAGRAVYSTILPLIIQLASAGKSLRSIAEIVGQAMGKPIAHTTVKYLLDKQTKKQ